MTPVQPRRRAGLFLLALRGRLMALAMLALAMLALAAVPGVVVAGVVPGELPAQVGRLSTVAGEVRWFDRDSESWLGAPPEPLRNWPVTAGDRLRTGVDGRAELRVGSTTLRLGPGCDLTLQRLDGQGLVLWLESGTLALRLSALLPGEGGSTEVQTAEGRWSPRAPGHYRIDRQADVRTPATLATTWRGEMFFEGRDSALTVPAGRRVDIWLDPAGSTRYAWAPVDRDAFADWVARDERLDDAPVSARYVPPGMTGWQDLDRNGDWVSHPDYGQLWQPRQVPVGWAPFHDGRWVWVAPWGWTWIDAAPWGFAPFHYGSWVVWRERWCWSPGPRHERPHYAPALRAWTGGPAVGAGTSIGININIGNTSGYRPPPPRVVIPVVLPPRMVVAPPTIIVISPPPRAWRGDPGQAAPPFPVPPRREPERSGRYDPALRDQDRRPPEGRDPDRHDPDRRDPGRREPDRRDRGGPVTAAPVTAAPVTAAPVTAAPVTAAPVTAAPVTAAPVTAAPVTAAPAPVPAAPVTAVPATGPATPAPVVSAAGPATPAPVGLARRFTPLAPPASPAPMPPAANPAMAQAPIPAAPRPVAAPPPAPTPPAPRPHDAEPGRNSASQRPDRGDRGDRGTAVR